MKDLFQLSIYREHTKNQFHMLCIIQGKWYHDNKRYIDPSMLEYSMMDCMFSRYIYPANGS